MSIAGITGLSNIPYQTDISYGEASGTGNINPGDWLMYSGQFILASYSGLASTAYWKASGAGVALAPNPTYDRYGNSVLNSSLLFLTQGILHVSASFSGRVALGVGGYPAASGSAVGVPTGRTGVGATWNTADVRSHSADPTAVAAPGPIATVIGSENFSNAGTGELIIRLLALQADVR